ncbi:MAG: orotidine-5'-phosphate decarboxylase [Gemmatimonadetes bacterium]|nr:orotidine-5'-phosphate decarboxylase [Gemmatimonadota bacterium]
MRSRANSDNDSANKETPLSFREKYLAAATRGRTKVCVGLDPDIQKLPEGIEKTPEGVGRFLCEIIDATHDLACVFKPNFAFFGALGQDGIGVLREIIGHIPNDVPTILDFKAGDIGNTAEKYAEMAYDVLQTDAVTVNPYMGFDAVEPFLRGKERCVFLLCLTSNPGSADFQRLETADGPLFEVVARTAHLWSGQGDCGLVVGATHPDDLPRVRQLAPTLPFLIPGVGSQGGSAADILGQAGDSYGQGVLINASRGILYASSGHDYADAARKAAEELRNAIEGN